MDALTLMVSLALVGGVTAFVLHPLWRHSRTNDTDAATRAEYQARYQAALAGIKELMFDYEMGKIAAEDYEALLARAKQEAAHIRRQLDHPPDVEANIEAMVADLRQSGLTGNKILLRQVDAEIERLKSRGETRAA
jgi:hypothetical protein